MTHACWPSLELAEEEGSAPRLQREDAGARLVCVAAVRRTKSRNVDRPAVAHSRDRGVVHVARVQAGRRGRGVIARWQRRRAKVRRSLQEGNVLRTCDTRPSPGFPVHRRSTHQARAYSWAAAASCRSMASPIQVAASRYSSAAPAGHERKISTYWRHCMRSPLSRPACPHGGCAPLRGLGAARACGGQEGCCREHQARISGGFHRGCAALRRRVMTPPSGPQARSEQSRRPGVARCLEPRRDTSVRADLPGRSCRMGLDVPGAPARDEQAGPGLSR